MWSLANSGERIQIQHIAAAVIILGPQHASYEIYFIKLRGEVGLEIILCCLTRLTGSNAEGNPHKR